MLSPYSNECCSQYANFSHSQWAEGLPCRAEVSGYKNGQLEIKPAEGGGPGYGLGVALKRGFDSLPSITKLFKSLFTFPQAAAAEIPPPRKIACQLTPVGNLTLAADGEGLDVSGTAVFLPNGYGNIEIVSTRHPENPTQIGTYNKTGESARDIAVTGGVACVANGGSGFQTLNITIPSSPSPLGAYDTTIEIADSVSVVGRYAYVIGFGKQDRKPRLFTILDVKNPKNPTFVGSYNKFDVTDRLLSAAIAKNKAFLGSEKGLTTLYIGNPSNPEFLSRFSTKGRVPSIAIQGDYVYLTEFVSSADKNKTGGFIKLNITNIFDPRVVHKFEFPQADQVTVLGDFAYCSDTPDSGSVTIYMFNISGSQLTPIGSHRMKGTHRLGGFKASGQFVYTTGDDARLKIFEPYCPSF